MVKFNALITSLFWICSGISLSSSFHSNSSPSKHLSHQVIREPTPTKTYMYHTVFGENTRFHLFWEFDEISITFELHAATTGWVGFGFSSHGGMKGADMVVGWITNNGEVFFKDMHALGRYRPKVDHSQGYDLLVAEERNNYTVFKFRRKLLPCDDNDHQIKDGTSRIIYAWGDEDPTSHDTFPYHKRKRGSVSVTLLDHNKPVRMQIRQQRNIKIMDLKMKTVNLPDTDTTYWCKLFKLPDFKKKVHIVEIEPLIQRGHETLVHHILVYLCSSFVSQFSRPEGRQCLYDQMVPANVANCDVIMFVYAIGMQGLVFPDNVGYPLGGKDDPKYIFFEVHYDNPRVLKGLSDTSGLRFYYTEQPRKHDAGVLEIGHTVWWPPMLIPPRAREFHVDNYCSGSCTKQYLPKSGINLLAVMLHTHLAGHRIWLKHIRNGIELPEIARDDNYDFNYQQFRLLSNQVKILPGDGLISTCTYRTRNRANFTLGGTSTRDEMCIHFIMYYPKVKLTKCLSTVYELLPVRKYVVDKVRSGEIDFDPMQKTNNIFSYFNRIKWTNKESRRFQKVINAIPTYREYCEHSGSGAGPMVSSMHKYQPKLKIKKRYKKNSTCYSPVSYQLTANSVNRNASLSVIRGLCILVFLYQLWTL